MARNSKKATTGNQKTAPASLEIAVRGITTGRDFANCMSALMSDLIAGKVSPGIGNAVCNAGAKLLKAVDMQMKYGTTDQHGNKLLTLALNKPLVEG